MSASSRQKMAALLIDIVVVTILIVALHMMYRRSEEHRSHMEDRIDAIEAIHPELEGSEGILE